MSDVKQYRVLILEDNPEDAELLQRRLRETRLNLRLKHASNKAEYVEGLENFCPDLIVSDYKLPEFDGLAALALAKEKHHRIPFIMVSGIVDDSFASRTLKAGVADYLLKDRPERLGSAVENALHEVEHRQLEEEYEKRTRELEIENEALKQRESRITQLRRELENLSDELKRSQIETETGDRVN